ncbi:MAG: hypothetical protein ABI472_18690 [Ginsengibacter sp.]
MILKTHVTKRKQAVKAIDWKLLVFLLLFLNVKLVVKIAAIILIYILQTDFKFGFRFRRSRLPLFYLFIIGIGVLDYCITPQIKSLNYSMVVVAGIGFWLLSILAIHQVKLSVELLDPQVIHQTISVFFIINAIISLGTLLIIIGKTGVINPYLYQGEYQLYFIGTGDYIRGISFDTSTTNAVLNSFGIIYFLSRKRAVLAFLCMIVLLLTGSNITNLVLCAALLFVFIFQSDKDQKSLILVCLFFLAIFLAKISPQNNQYLANSFRNIFNEPSEHANVNGLRLEDRPDSTLGPEERKQKVALLYLDSISALSRKKLAFIHSVPATPTPKLAIPVDDINGPTFQHKSFTTQVEENMYQFINDYPGLLVMSSDTAYHTRYPGKIIAWQQTYKYLSKYPMRAIAGSGIGTFSSKLAFKTSGLKIAGSWPENYTYINNEFLQNHLDAYLYYFSKTDGYHSAINNPASVYDQLITEYGIIGLAVFLIFYVGFFLKDFRDLSFGIPLIIVITGIFFFDYWFEQLSIVIFFELLMFLNIKEKKLRNE